MKKVFIIITVLIGLLMPMYVIFFWEPYEDISNSEEKVCNNNIKEVNIDSFYNEDENVAENKNIILKNKDADVGITKEEKEKLNDLKKRLSIVDIEKVENALKNSDKDKGVKEALKIIKKRVSSKDYNLIKEIYSKNIDFSLVES